MQGEKYLVAADLFLVWPELALSEPVGAELLVAEETLDNLETFSRLGLIQPVGEIVREGVLVGTLRLIPRKIWSSYAEYLAQGRVSAGELWLDDTLVRLAHDEQATLATDEPRHRKLAKRMGVRTISGADLLRRVTAPPPSEKLSAVVHSVGRAIRYEAFFSFAATCVIVAGAAYLFEDAPSLVARLRPWVPPLAIVAAGIVLYVIRRNLRVAYGAAEVLVGMLTGWHITDSSGDHALWPVALQILAAMYIIARGIDNIALGWPESILSVWWRRFRGPYHAA
jgi:hypothetical protein